MKIELNARIKERFYNMISPEPNTGCWLWAGGKQSHGYGTLWLDGRVVYAHRLAWGLTHGSIPPGMHVLHRCDTPACVNPDHLFLGTQQDNARDMAAKGRGANQNTGKDRCKRGHLFTPENTGVSVARHSKRPGRRCLTCVRERWGSRIATSAKVEVQP